MRIAIHQPQYLPWLGYLDKLDRTDVFVLLDTVQFKKNEWQNRNRIRTAQGWQYLTVPVLHEFPQRLDQVRINNQTDWRRKHQTALETHYRKAPHYERYAPAFRDLYRRAWERLAPPHIAGMSAIDLLFNCGRDGIELLRKSRRSRV